jgi:hypothetical protein
MCENPPNINSILGPDEYTKSTSYPSFCPGELVAITRSDGSVRCGRIDEYRADGTWIVLVEMNDPMHFKTIPASTRHVFKLVRPLQK